MYVPMARLPHVGHIGNLAESATEEGSDRSDSSLGADRYLAGQRSLPQSCPGAGRPTRPSDNIERVWRSSRAVVERSHREFVSAWKITRMPERSGQSSTAVRGWMVLLSQEALAVSRPTIQHLKGRSKRYLNICLAFVHLLSTRYIRYLT